MKKWGKRIGVALLVLLALAFLLLFVGLGYVKSSAGSARIRKIALDTVNGSISGRIEAQGLALDGLTGVTLENVKLYDPEGKLVAEIHRIELAHTTLLALRADRIHLQSVTIDAPRLYLRDDTKGLNLMRALAAKNVRPSDLTGTKGPPQHSEISVASFELSHGYVDFVQETASTSEPDRHYRLDGFHATGSAKYTTAPDTFDVALDSAGDVQLPLQAPLKLSLRATGEGVQKTSAVQFSLGGAELSLKAGSKGSDDAQGEWTSLKVPPDVARAFLPSWPLIAALGSTGSVRQHGNLVSFELSALAASATAKLSGGFDVARFRGKDVKLSAEHVNLSELISGAPPSDLKLELAADGGGTSLNNLDATATLDIPESEFNGQRLGPVRARAIAKNGQFDVPLAVVLPGTEVSGTAKGSLEAFSGELLVHLRDLKATQRTLMALGGKEPLPLSGRGELDISASGSVAHPSVKVRGAFPSLRYADDAVSGFQVDAQLPDATKPLESQAALSAAQIVAGARKFDDLRAKLSTHGRSITAEVSTRGLSSMVLRSSATLDEDQHGAAVTELELSYPEADWKLVSPSHVSFGDELVVEPLTLKAGDQSLSVEARKSETRLSARVRAGRLELSKLPAALVDKSLNLAGEVQLAIDAEGSPKNPRVTTKLLLGGGRYRGLTGLSADVDGSFIDGRVKGTVKTSSSIGEAEGELDVPVVAVLKRRHEPLSVKLRVPKLDLAQAKEAFELAQPVEGVVDADLDVSGFAEDPRVALTLHGTELRSGAWPPKEQPPANITLIVTPGEGGAITADLEATGLGSHARAHVETPFTVAKLREHPPGADELLDAPMKLSVDADKVDLGAIEQGTKGIATLRVDGHGSARAPQGRITASVVDLSRQGSEPLSFDLAGEFDAASVRLGATLRAAAGKLLEVSARADAGLDRLLDRKLRDTTPFELRGELSPTELKTLRALSGASSGNELGGVLSGVVQVTGSLNDPSATLNASVADLGVQGQKLGRVHATWSYGSAKHQAVVVLASNNGGSAKLSGNGTLDVSLPAIRRGLELGRAPFEAMLVARSLDLSMLSGLSPKVRAVAGTLDADGRASGAIGSPTWNGSAEWKNGRFALMGYGEYRNVHIKANASPEVIVLEDFSAESGGGKAEVIASARRNGGLFDLTAKGKLTKFPLIMDDQLFALATLDTTARGTASATLIDISDLSIPSATIELPQIKRKDLQDLDRPDDVVLMKDGEWLDKKQQRRRLEAAARAKGEPVAAIAGPAPDESALTYHVVVNAPGGIEVKGADVNATLGLSEAFRVEYRDNLQLFGVVNILTGRAEVIGRRFDVQKDSQVRFQGAAKQPFSAITAVYTNEREQVTVYMNIRGVGTDVQLKPTSQPPLSESEIWTLLATGRRQLKRGSGSSMTGAEAATIVSSAIASELRKTLPSKIPLDVVSLEAGDQGLVGSRLEAGTYITDKIYVGYTGQLGADPLKGENSNAVRFEYQITPRWSFESSYGDANAGGADIVWTRDY